MKERLQKIIARAGLASRREAEKWIEEGRVTVNGTTIHEQGFSADPLKDHIKVNGKLLRPLEDYFYYLLNKPKGVVTTVSDPDGRPTVMDLMATVKERLFPVGRLDMNTEGALLLTNDGDLANQLLKPATKCPKTYLVKVAGVPSYRDLSLLRRGITVDGLRYSKCDIQVVKSDKNSWLTVVLKEGKNHQIKNMFQAVGHPVSKLRRIGFAFLTLTGLEPGEFRELSAVEIDRLKRGDVNPLKPITPYKTLRQIGVTFEPEKASPQKPQKPKDFSKGPRKSASKSDRYEKSSSTERGRRTSSTSRRDAESPRSGGKRRSPDQKRSDQQGYSGGKPGRKSGERTGGKPGERERTGGRPGDRERTGGRPGGRERTGGRPGDRERTGGKPGGRERTGGKPGGRERTGGKPGGQSKGSSRRPSQQRTQTNRRKGK